MSRGAKFAKDVREKFELNLAEDLLVDEIAAVLDVLAGDLSVSERRQQQSLLSRLLYQINLPEEGSEDRATLTTRKASRAARARWQKESI